jgi:hypothetical protein
VDGSARVRGRHLGAASPVNPAGYVSASLNSVWCASASDCIAVGDYQNSSDAYGALAEQEHAKPRQRHRG